jgi:cyclopropane fatty-acyl-phospholipid synthase-like methyltransferase
MSTTEANVAKTNPAHLRWKWLDRTAVTHILLLAATLSASIVVDYTLLLIYPLFLIAADIAYYFFKFDVFDPEETVQRGYQMSTFTNDNPHSEGLDYGFNYYDGDYTKPRKKAQFDKFDYAIDQLGLKPGMRVIDIGCGCGDWLNYLRDKGMNVTGVNITLEQANECRKRGLDVIWTNWKDIPNSAELQGRLFGQYDAVTFWDTVEHYVPMKLRRDIDAQNQIYSNMFTLANNLLDQDSEVQRIFISCLHQRIDILQLPLWERVKKFYYIYLLDKMHSGYYPDGLTDQLVQNAKQHFELVSRKDVTIDYYMTSKLEPTHFGRHKITWTLKKASFGLYVLLTDPHWFQRGLWLVSETWMFQFNEQDIDKSDMLLWWLTMERSAA